jgi:hypothetical protein
MGLSENIETIRRDIGTNAQNFFIYYFKKFPNDQQFFGNYARNKNPEELRHNPAFSPHVTKVMTKLLEIADKVANGESIKSYGEELKSMPQHATLGISQFDNMFTALVDYLGTNMAGFDRNGFERIGRNLVAALKGAGMQ